MDVHIAPERLAGGRGRGLFVSVSEAATAESSALSFPAGETPGGEGATDEMK